MKRIIFVMFVCFFGTIVNANAYNTLFGLTIANPNASWSPASDLVIEDGSRGTSLDNQVPTTGTPEGYTGDDYTGLYVGTVDGGAHMWDSEENIEALMTSLLGSAYDFELFEGATLTYDDASNTSGGWDVSSITPPSALSLYTVKSSTQWALYYLDPALQQGIWTTAHLEGIINGPNSGDPQAISHFRGNLVANGGGGDPPDAIPEPATMLLFGTGLIGLAGLRLRRKK